MIDCPQTREIEGPEHLSAAATYLSARRWWLNRRVHLPYFLRGRLAERRSERRCGNG